MNGDGSIFCSHCNRSTGDGIAGLQWLTDEDLPTTLKHLADHLHIGKPATNGHSKKNGQALKSKTVETSNSTGDKFENQFSRWDSKLLNITEKFNEFAANKRPITLDAIIQSGAFVCTWPNSREHGKQCLAWPAFNKPGELTGYILRRIDGKEFDAFGGLSVRKTHMLRGSHDGWVIPGGFDRVARSLIVWRVEGIPDALALFSKLPPDHAVVTNICGAGSVKDLNLEIMRGKTVFSVGDADEPGQDGAAKFADASAAVADEVRIVKLPYEIDESHGRDVRDYFADGGTFAMLLEIANSTEIVDKPISEDIKTEPAIKIRSAGDLIKEYPELRPPVIEGLVRRGETMNIIAAPKTGKSWLAVSLGMAVVSGQKWLGRFWTTQGNVLIVDNELHPETSAHRLPKIAEAMKVPKDDYVERLFVANLRGQLVDMNKLASQLTEIEENRFSLIILDAWYRFQPVGTDENSNGDVAALYNSLDSVASKIGAAFVAIHHTSKGNQAGKGVTDVGAGAGAQSRAPDTHLTMRAHEEDQAVVVEAAVRSWAPMDAFCLRWNFPVWSPADDLDPKDLKQERPKKKSSSGEESGPSKDQLQKQVDAENLEKILTAYRTFPNGETESILSASAGLNFKYFRPINAQLIRGGRVVSVDVQKSRKKPFPGFKLVDPKSTPTLRHSDKTQYSSDLSDYDELHTPTLPPPLGGSICRSATPQSDTVDPLWLPTDKPNGGQPA